LSLNLKPHLWFTLFHLLRLGANRSFIRLSTTDLSKIIGGSQQSASRHLQLLEDADAIIRKIEQRGSKIKISDKGLSELTYISRELKWYLEGKEAETIVIEGVVVSGLFEGAYYISKDGYRNQIIDKLEFDPFPGTLNVKISDEYLESRRHLDESPSIKLHGFKDGERAFGSCRCYPVKINDEVNGALIVADRTTHDYNILEIISPHYLRRKLGLADGDTIKMSFSPLRRSEV
jgi:riboflavin kinase